MNRTEALTREDDERETPAELFGKLNERFDFTLDACASHDNAKCDIYYTVSGRFESFEGMPVQGLGSEDGLTGSWEGERVWCNPPFSGLAAWVLKAWESKADLVCMLVPATRAEQGWWQELIELYRDGKGTGPVEGVHLTTEFLAGRQHFLKDGKPILNPKTGTRSSPKFGCVLLIWSFGP